MLQPRLTWPQLLSSLNLEAVMLLILCLPTLPPFAFSACHISQRQLAFQSPNSYETKTKDPEFYSWFIFSLQIGIRCILLVFKAVLKVSFAKWSKSVKVCEVWRGRERDMGATPSNSPFGACASRLWRGCSSSALFGTRQQAFVLTRLSSGLLLESSHSSSVSCLPDPTVVSRLVGVRQFASNFWGVNLLQKSFRVLTNPLSCFTYYKTLQEALWSIWIFATNFSLLHYPSFCFTTWFELILIDQNYPRIPVARLDTNSQGIYSFRHALRLHFRWYLRIQDRRWAKVQVRKRTKNNFITSRTSRPIEELCANCVPKNVNKKCQNLLISYLSMWWKAESYCFPAHWEFQISGHQIKSGSSHKKTAAAAVTIIMIQLGSGFVRFSCLTKLIRLKGVRSCSSWGFFHHQVKLCSLGKIIQVCQLLGSDLWL